MRKYKIPTTASVFVSKKQNNSNYNSSYNLILGRYTDDEFKSLVTFNLNPRLFELNLYRADLVIYIDDAKIDMNIESFMLNISRNLESFDAKTVTWETAPKFFQEANFSKISSDYSGNYIKLDITKLLEYWIKHRISIFGLTLMGLSDSSLLYLANSVNKRPFIDLYIDEANTTPYSCDTTEIHHSCNNNIKNDCNSLIYTPQTTNHNNLIYEDPYKDELLFTNTQNHPNKSNSKLNAFGNFLSLNGSLENFRDISYVKFDSENNVLRTNLTINRDGIFILLHGTYKVDFFINCRAQAHTTVELELDSISINYTRIEISTADVPTSASTIINVAEDNMILKLKISTINALLINTGICASLNLMKID
ncbi:MAG: DNRLRE domain-containing protein [Sarcina sp.]